ncbi:uncharacterized protein MAM_08401 [Metarhizium album ARSEF 1941]|uniref:Uncharacterized protein n=1 Tax=Metarhizium album (strain ARSEF 1941) TaxID=1081103 RepID=A0A0B2WL37_METAS|nr:uncharacterized protein MAM_08401 [Metarhizium album ARSEF 1941]KHN93730.1 hypothetical protein MAM_08401 [Metarhizium album ARSEF 1941]
MVDSDTKLRLKTSCATAHGYYDQIVAVSQKIINESFDKLYDVYPEYGVVDFSSKKIGKIKGNLLSPRLLLGGGLGSDISLTSALYVMRFKDGEISIPADDDDDPDQVEDLTGWNLAVTIDLKEQSVYVDPDADPDTQADQQALWDFIHNKFDVPGDYSIARLYAKLADAHWSNFDYDNSQFGYNPDGSPRSWAQLKKQFEGIDISLPFMLRKWAETQEKKGLTTTGVQFNLPPPDEIDPNKPTFQPTALVHQVYGYQNPEKGVPKPVISYDPPGDLNSFLYCEMVSNHELPTDKQLAGSGNFTAQATEIGGPRIDGTYALSHQLFLETFLLPMLQAFNKSSIIFPTTPGFTTEGGNSKIYWNYAIGNDGKHQDFKDEYYKFQPVYELATPADPTCYRFKADYSTQLVPTGHNTTSGTYGSFDSTATTQVDFKWNPGDAGFSLAGTTVYKYDVEWSENWDMRRPFGWLRETFQSTWSMKINIDSVKDGILQLGVDAGASEDCNSTVRQTQAEQQQSWSPPGQADRIRSSIVEQIGSHVKTLKSNLSEKFQTSAKFVYPGNGTFDFSDPQVGNTGEILATLEYKPIDRKAKISVPPPATAKMTPMKFFGFNPKQVDAPGVAPTSKLNWSYSKPIKGVQKAAEVLIQGTNKGEDTVKLKGLSVLLDSEPKGRAPITGLDFSVQRWKIGSPDETGKVDVYQIVSDNDGTPAFESVNFAKGEKVGDATPLTFYGTGEVSVEPGATLTLALYTGTGVPNTYDVIVTETWPPVDGQASQSLAQTVKIILSP